MPESKYHVSRPRSEQAAQGMPCSEAHSLIQDRAQSLWPQAGALAVFTHVLSFQVLTHHTWGERRGGQRQDPSIGILKALLPAELCVLWAALDLNCSEHFICTEDVCGMPFL